VDAKEAAAARFYRKYGFIAFPENSQKLFLPMGTIRQLLEPNLRIEPSLQANKKPLTPLCAVKHNLPEFKA